MSLIHHWGRIDSQFEIDISLTFYTILVHYMSISLLSLPITCNCNSDIIGNILKFQIATFCTVVNVFQYHCIHRCSCKNDWRSGWESGYGHSGGIDGGGINSGCTRDQVNLGPRPPLRRILRDIKSGRWRCRMKRL